VVAPRRRPAADLGRRGVFFGVWAVLILVAAAFAPGLSAPDADAGEEEED
jgi:hypothetical protein